MTTIDQALSLLDAFNETRPELGLTEIAAFAGFDKAKARRYLLALIRRGFIEQNEANRKYRLGPAPLSLARLREACFPLEACAVPVLEAVVGETGETAHLSLYASGTLSNVAVVESPKAHRVAMDRGDPLPLHATASGLAFLAYQDEADWRDMLKGRLKAYTAATITDRKTLFRTLRAVRSSGVASANGSYDEGVRSYAIPVFGLQPRARGALAVAAPGSRVSRTHVACIRTALERAAERLSAVRATVP